MLLGELGTTVGPLDGLLDAPYALVDPVHQDYVGGHTNLFLLFLLALRASWLEALSSNAMMPP